MLVSFVNSRADLCWTFAVSLLQYHIMTYRIVARPGCSQFDKSNFLFLSSYTHQWCSKQQNPWTSPMTSELVWGESCWYPLKSSRHYWTSVWRDHWSGDSNSDDDVMTWQPFPQITSHFWLISRWTIKNKLQCIFNQNFHSRKKNAIENVVYKMPAMLLRSQYAKLCPFIFSAWLHDNEHPLIRGLSQKVIAMADLYRISHDHVIPWNAFLITGPLWWESTSNPWIPLTKG